MEFTVKKLQKQPASNAVSVEKIRIIGEKPKAEDKNELGVGRFYEKFRLDSLPFFKYNIKHWSFVSNKGGQIEEIGIN